MYGISYCKTKKFFIIKFHHYFYISSAWNRHHGCIPHVRRCQGIKTFAYQTSHSHLESSNGFLRYNTTGNKKAIFGFLNDSCVFFFFLRCRFILMVLRTQPETMGNGTSRDKNWISQDFSLEMTVNSMEEQKQQHVVSNSCKIVYLLSTAALCK